MHRRSAVERITQHSTYFCGPRYKSYRTHGTVENKIESFSLRFSIFYDSMSSDCDLYHAPSFKKLLAEPFISVSLCLLLFAFGAWYNMFHCGIAGSAKCHDFRFSLQSQPSFQDLVATGAAAVGGASAKTCIANWIDPLSP